MLRSSSLLLRQLSSLPSSSLFPCERRMPFACSSSATLPATCGDDIDVPLSDPCPPCSSGRVDQMKPPGAPMSGLRVKSAARP